jgi:hypothetical protein
MIENFGGKALLIVFDQRNFISSGNVGGGYDGKFAPRNAIPKTNGADAAAWNAAAHRHPVQHIRNGEIVYVPGKARDFFPSLFTDDGMSEIFFFHNLWTFLINAWKKTSAVQRAFAFQ